MNPSQVLGFRHSRPSNIRKLFTDLKFTGTYSITKMFFSYFDSMWRSKNFLITQKTIRLNGFKVMKFRMLRGSQNTKIRYSIIKSIVINMMNFLVGSNFFTNMLFHKITMKRNNPSKNFNPVIATNNIWLGNSRKVWGLQGSSSFMITLYIAIKSLTKLVSRSISLLCVWLENLFAIKTHESHLHRIAQYNYKCYFN